MIAFYRKLGLISETCMQESDGERLMSLERYSHLVDLVNRGNNAFRQNRLDEVIF